MNFYSSQERFRYMPRVMYHHMPKATGIYSFELRSDIWLWIDCSPSWVDPFRFKIFVPVLYIILLKLPSWLEGGGTERA